MKDKTVDFEEGFSLARAYLCKGSHDWLIEKDSDSRDVKIITWVRKLSYKASSVYAEIMRG